MKPSYTVCEDGKQCRHLRKQFGNSLNVDREVTLRYINISQRSTGKAQAYAHTESHPLMIILAFGVMYNR